MEQLVKELKQHLIEELNLEEITVDDIDTDAPLFGDGLGLDSIDALEVILILENIMVLNCPILQKQSLYFTLSEHLLNTLRKIRNKTL